MDSMPRFSTNLFMNNEIDRQVNGFWDNEPLLFADESQQADSILNTLIFKVIRKPRDLIAHLRRIYFCYQNALSEPLYAALVDFLIVLNGKGRSLSVRLIHGCRSQLDPAQIVAFKSAVSGPCQMTGNRYSLFTTGTLGTSQVVEISRNNRQEHRDYLTLADDFIEFSQLEEAMSILEVGLDRQPERQDLQVALLELYRSTNSRERFNNSYEAIKAVSVPLADEWQLLADFFDGNTI